MKNDPFHLFSKKEKASLGILSADGDFERIITKDFKKVNIKEWLELKKEEKIWN